jgi:hypothetical protein
MKRHLMLQMLVLAFFLRGTLIAGTEETLTLRATTASPMRSTPGSTVTLGARVNNAGRDSVALTSRMELPEGWKVLAHQPDIMVAPFSSDIRLLLVRIPSDASPQEYTVRYHVRSRTGNAVNAAVAFVLRVQPLYRMEVSLLDAPASVPSGARYALRFAVTNTGNAVIHPVFEARSSHGSPIDFDSSIVTLLPHQSTIITASVEAPAVTDKSTQHTVEYFAKAAESSTFLSHAVATTVITPQAGAAGSRYHKFPVVATVRAVGDDNGTGFQGEIAGTGSLAESGSGRLEFLLRSPETQSRSELGLLDEYRVRYSDDHYDLFAGDMNYSLSTLTEAGRYAFGVSGQYQSQTLKVGGFVNRTRFITVPQRETALFGIVRPGGNFEIGANVLHTVDSATGTVASLRTIVSPFRYTTLDLEYARSFSSTGGDDAIALRLFGGPRQIMYEARYLEAGPNARGYYRDIRLGSLGVTLYGPENLRLELLARAQKRNLRQDSTLVYAPDDYQVQFGIGLANALLLSYRTTGEQDQYSLYRTFRRDDVWQLRASMQFSSWAVSATADAGTSHDLIAGLNSPYRRVAGFISLWPWAGTSASGSVEWSRDQDLFTGTLQNRWSAGFNASVAITPSTSFLVNVAANSTVASAVQNYALFDVSLEQYLPGGHRVSLRGRRSLGRTLEPQSAFALELSVPVGIPLAPIASSGTLHGVVLDEQGRGISNALLSLDGSATMTERDGSFFFPPLAPGMYYLLVDKSTIGVDRVTTAPLPLPVEVRGGADVKVRLSVVRSGAVSGKLQMFHIVRIGGRDTLVESSLDAGRGDLSVHIELTDGAETQRRITDAYGRFSIADLRPGIRVMTVTPMQIPEGMRLEQERREITIAPGDRQEVLIRVIPRKRILRMLQQTTLIADSTKRHSMAPDDGDAATGDTCIILALPAGGYVIQESSWLTSAKASAQAAIIQASFIVPAYIEHAILPEGSARYRVFVGPFPTRIMAQDMCSRMMRAPR